MKHLLLLSYHKHLTEAPMTANINDNIMDPMSPVSPLVEVHTSYYSNIIDGREYLQLRIEVCTDDVTEFGNKH